MSASTHFAFERDIVEMEGQISRLREAAAKRDLDVADELRVLTAKLDVLRDETYRNLTPMEQVQVARHPRRPYTLDFIDGIFTDWFELRGDRRSRDDEAVVGGSARLSGRSVLVIGPQTGRDTQATQRRHSGRPPPEGYRKSPTASCCWSTRSTRSSRRRGAPRSCGVRRRSVRRRRTRFA